ncbi:MAG: polyketide synthase dehydratase domain-containing protein [Syntrophobacteraceae bacterium]
MEQFSSIAVTDRVAVTIQTLPHWSDHHFLGRPVLPAVEAMELLAGWVDRFRPGSDVRYIGEAQFDKFLELPPSGGCIEAWCEMQDLMDGRLRACLLTKTSAKSGMRRTRVHAKLVFYPPVELSLPDLDLACALEGICLSIDPGLIYQQLVPFGPRFQSICAPLKLTEEGALALIQAPEAQSAQKGPHLGSSFVLDGAFHAACVWAQRFAGIVAFPVGIAKRFIASPTQPGNTYVGRIFPVETEQALLSFDIWIVDKEGRLFEKLEGVRMRDVSGGKVVPPDWVRSRGAGTLRRIAQHCAAVGVIDQSTLMPFSNRCLSEGEHRRTLKMGNKRLTDYLSSRLVCKRLSRQLSGNDRHTFSQDIDTLAQDGIRPCCPASNGVKYHCSVSHDRRLVVAAASKRPIGLDVERLDAKVLKGMELFMDIAEQQMVMASALGPIGAALRVWTTKEAVAKMLNIHLADAWARAHLIAIDEHSSALQIKNGPEAKVVHELIDDHLITLVSVEQ